MAISKLKPRHVADNKTVGQTLKERLDYGNNPEKTNGGEFVTTYQCNAETAHKEFLISKQLYSTATGRSQPREHDIISYLAIQSFVPGEIAPEQANRLGFELAMAFTEGQHQFIVSTHIDQKHIHNHIEINSTTLDCYGKFNNYKNSSFNLRKMNDKICAEYGLSVIQNPNKKGKKYNEWQTEKQGTSWKGNLKETIDKLLSACHSFDEFLAVMSNEGYEIKQGKYIAFRAAGQEQFLRGKTLGDAYTETALRECIDMSKTNTILPKKPKYSNTKKVNLLIDITAKLQAGKGVGYERWAKVFNLKEAAKTLNFLTEKGITNYDVLANKTEELTEKFNAVFAKIKDLEYQMTEVATLKKHIVNYSKTREVFVKFKKLKDKAVFRKEHEPELLLHEAAKAAFNELKADKLPTMAQLQEQYTTLLSSKKEQYIEYKALKKDLLEYETAKQNIDRLLHFEHDEKENRKLKKITL